MTRYFKKISPRVRLQLSNGLNLQFDDVDGEWGILKTENPDLFRELDACIKGERGGVFELTEKEFLEQQEKKTTLRPSWREEITKSGAAPRPLPTSPPSVPQNVAVSLENGFAPAPSAQQTEPVKPAATFRPKATPRK